jgi:hypothetical protein
VTNVNDGDFLTELFAPPGYTIEKQQKERMNDEGNDL